MKIQVTSSSISEKMRNHHKNDYIHLFNHKNTIKFLLVFFVLFVSTNHIWGQTYCTSYGNTTYNTSITRVIFNTIDNTSAKPSGYSDYTSLSTNLVRGNTYNLSTYVNTDGNYRVYVTVWIDWNQNGSFTDSGESYDLGNAKNKSNGITSNSPLSITVPSTATYGTTRMRVSVEYNTYPTSCLTGFDGEVEDYTINVPPPQYQSKTSGNWNLSSTWQKSLDGGITWFNATDYPTSSNNTLVTIQSGHTVTLTQAETTNNTVVNGSLDVSSYSLTGVGTLTVNSGGTVYVGGASNFPTGFSTMTLNTGSTVNYNRSGNQTVASINYSNLILSGSSTKTLQTGTTSVGGDLTLSGTANTTTVVGLTIGGNLNIGDGTTFTTGGYNLTVTGNTTVGNGSSGIMNIGSYNGTKIFTGLLTINSGGTWNNSANSPVTFRGGITNNGTFTAGSTYVYTFDTNNQSLNGTINMSGSTMTITGIVLTNYGTLTTTSTVGGSGTLGNSSTGTLNSSGDITITTLTNAGTFNKTGGNLTPTTLTNTGTLNISGSVYTNPTTFTNSGIINLSSSSGIGTTTANFTNTGTINLNGTAYITGMTNNAGGTVNFINSSQTIGTFINATATSVLNISALLTSASAINVLTATASGNTVYYSGAGNQTVKNTTYSNLIISGSGNKTLGGATTVTNILTLTSGILVTTSTNLLSVTNTSSAAISGGSSSSYINGPVKWTLPASLASGSTYTFPVGKTSYLPFALVNPTTGTGTINAQVEAFNTNSGGSADGTTLFSISNTEYWSLITSGNFTNSSVSVTRQTAISPYDAIGGSTTLTGAYTSLGGTVGTYGITNSNSIGSYRYFTIAQKRSITTGTITGFPFCSGTSASVSVPFTITGTYNSGNVFTAQLSNASGSFSSPTNIGTLTSTSAGTISATIPSSQTAGTGYRIRVISSNPVVTGSDNGTDLIINGTPSAAGSITGSTTVTQGQSGVSYSISSITYTTSYVWSYSGTGATINGTGNSVTIDFSVTATSGTLTVYGINSCGNGTSASLAISVSNGTVFWLKADAGTSTTTNGASVNTWTDQSSTGNNGTAQSTAPTYTSMLWNFNPSISFSAGYFQISRGTLQDDMTFYFLYNSTQTTSSANWWTMPAIIGNEANGTVDDFGLGQNGGKIYSKLISGDTPLQTTSTYNTGVPQLVSATRKKASSGSSQTIYVNGTQALTGASDNVSLTNFGNIGIGCQPTQATAQYVGGISEVVGQNYLATTTQRWAFESYLAIKYGVTLSHDYKKISSSSDSLIYTISGYANDIAGLGRNATYGLNQKVSSSSNVSSGSARVVMATDNDFTSSNLSASRTSSLTDGQHLIWGHNNGTVNSWTAIASTNYSRVNRIWRVQNTGSVGTVYFQIDLTSFPTLPSGYDYVVLVGNSSFSSINNFYTLTNTSGNLYTAQPTFPSGTYYFTIAAAPNYWMGTTSSTDWGTGSNWTGHHVPSSGKDVIFATVSNYGTDAQNDLELDQDRIVGNLINNTDRQLIIPTGTSLTVNNTLTSGTDPNLIRIKAKSSSPNGSLIFTQPSLNTNVQATVEMYAKGYKGTTQTWTGGDGKTYTTSYKWQYFGSPVQTLTASPTFDGSWVRLYDETMNGSSYYQKWTQLVNSSTISPFKGYEITQDAAKIVSIQGSLVVGDATLNLTVSGGYGSGYNIFGNSYVAAIDISKIQFPSSGVDKTVYLYNTGSLADWGGGSSYTAIPYNITSILGNEIPSMQGFLLIATTNNSTVTIPYNATTNSLTKNTIQQKVNQYKITDSNNSVQVENSVNSDLSYMKIEANSENYYDYAWIFDEENTSHGFDNGWDGYKLASAQDISIYSDEQIGNLQVNTLNKIDSVYLSFKAGSDTQYTLKINSVNLLDKYDYLYLTDLTTGTSEKIDANTITYTFTANNTTEAEKRFLISGLKKTVTEQNNPFIITSNSAGELIVINNGSEVGQLYVYDAIGRLITAGYNCPAETSTNIPQKLQGGVYITKIVTENKKEYKKKVIVR